MKTRGGAERGECQRLASPIPHPFGRTQQAGSPAEDSFQKDIQMDSLGPQGASVPSPTPKTFLGPLLPLPSLPLPTAPSQSAKGSTAKESYLLSATFIPVCLLWVCN